MFDSPDFSFRDLNETLDLEDRFDADNLLLNSEIRANVSDLVENSLTEEDICPVKNNLLLSCNGSGQYFSTRNNELMNDLSKDRYSQDETATITNLITPGNSFYDTSTLLDDNTVDQFLLPNLTSETEKDGKSNGPDVLALYSCVICHDIFTTDADLLDHTILMHASVNLSNSENITTNVPNSLPEGSSTNIDAEWLVCGICERVLAMALEAQPCEQLCCLDLNGKACVGSRLLSSMFVCDVCSYLFADGDALDRHKLTCFRKNDDGLIQLEDLEPTKNETKCRICGHECYTEAELATHMTTHGRRVRREYKPGAKNKMWNCGSCNQLFSTARELYRHKRGEDRAPGAPLMAYVCEECDKVLGSVCALHTHKKMHKVSKPGYPCKICGRRFNQSGHLAIHMRMHTGERPYPCDLCPKAFKVKVERDDHRRTHTGERPFACPSCPKTFTAAARLREHARIHTDQRPYICDICGAAFRRPYARTVHTLIHTGQKPHKCDVCGTAFRRSGDMWKHKRTLHGIQANEGEPK